MKPSATSERTNGLASPTETFEEESVTPPSTEPPHVRLVIALDPLLTVLSIVLDLVKVILLGVPLIVREIYTMFVPRPQKDVRGQVALITGGGNGLGRAMAQLFAARGCQLVLVDIDLQAAERTAEELRQQYGVAARAYRVDVSQYEQCRALGEQIERDGAGPVDILINNAGLIMFAFVNDSDVERANSVMDVNMKSHVWVSSLTDLCGTTPVPKSQGQGCHRSCCILFPFAFATLRRLSASNRHTNSVFTCVRVCCAYTIEEAV
uniref:Uncharacterized protein n=1 Tax=Anopheles merus TaxID=30066 RepID=A0A182VDD2_ANOME